MRAITKKRSFLAYWLKASFAGIQGPNYLKLLFLGAHKPRNLKHMEAWEEAQRLEDFRPKFDFAFLYTPRPSARSTGAAIEVEAVPFPVIESFRIFAALNVLSTTNNLIAESDQKAAQWQIDPPLPGWAYIERDMHEVQSKDLIAASVKAKNFYTSLIPNPDDRPTDLRWLRGSLMWYDREHHESGDMIHQFLAVGQDLRTGTPVLGMRKQWQTTDLGTVIPLVGDLAKLITTSMTYMITHPPADQPFESSEAFRREVTKAGLLLADRPDFQAIEFLTAPGADLLNQLAH